MNSSEARQVVLADLRLRLAALEAEADDTNTAIEALLRLNGQIPPVSTPNPKNPAPTIAQDRSEPLPPTQGASPKPAPPGPKPDAPIRKARVLAALEAALPNAGDSKACSRLFRDYNDAVLARQIAKADKRFRVTGKGGNTDPYVIERVAPPGVKPAAAPKPNPILADGIEAMRRMNEKRGDCLRAANMQLPKIGDHKTLDAMFHAPRLRNLAENLIAGDDRFEVRRLTDGVVEIWRVAE